MLRRKLFASLAALLLALPAAAADFPTRPVTIIVPFPPGGATDVAARMMAEGMAPLLGQPVLVDNKPGAQTVIGAEAVARAQPDGHTILMASGTTLTLNPLLPDRLPYKSEDFSPIVLVTKLPFAVVVRNGLPTTIADFVKLAQSRNGSMNYGSNGPTSFNNLAAVAVLEGMKMRMQEITYRGDAQQLNDLMGGTLDVIVVGGSSGLAAHRSGRGRIIGWTGEERLAVTPEIPNFSELGPDMVVQTWFGLLAPARTPAAAINRLNAVALRALQSTELRDRLLAEGQFVAGGSPDDFATFLAQQAERWRPVVARLAGKRE
ncbi:tripartite tricarboxylate transporter substrate binding protein [Roseomonas sp. 18066]|uniref:tripartite tricarboxylate transporter substrate binding protein n=1 Tax=Roseomonas sp. 18066 TaxID=2681412 RepID=UPI001358218F|nr:tripartite tricarboxylate transporter substrate binding protein [Roseomonas sp. 18066]